MAPSFLHRLAAHPALLLIFIILPFVLLSAVVKRIRNREADCYDHEYYELMTPANPNR